MGFDGNNRKTRNDREPFILLKERFANVSRGPPRSFRKRFRRLPCVIKVFKEAAICGNLGGTTELSSSQRHFMAGMEAFFIFRKNRPVYLVI